MTAMAGESDQQVLLRPVTRQFVPALLPPLVITVGAFGPDRGPSGVVTVARVLCVLAVLIALTNLVLSLTRTRVLLTPEGITVTLVRRRTFRWDEVAGVVVPGPAKRSGRSVALRLADGRKLRLPTPADGLLPDPAFPERAETVREFWQRHGADAR